MNVNDVIAMADRYDWPLSELLVTEIHRLRAIVARLPSGADNQPIVPGDEAWVNKTGEPIPTHVAIEAIHPSYADTILVGQLRKDGDELWEECPCDIFSTAESAADWAKSRKLNHDRKTDGL